MSISIADHSHNIPIPLSPEDRKRMRRWTVELFENRDRRVVEELSWEDACSRWEKVDKYLRDFDRYLSKQESQSTASANASNRCLKTSTHRRRDTKGETKVGKMSWGSYPRLSSDSDASSGHFEEEDEEEKEIAEPNKPADSGEKMQTQEPPATAFDTTSAVGPPAVMTHPDNPHPLLPAIGADTTTSAVTGTLPSSSSSFAYPADPNVAWLNRHNYHSQIGQLPGRPFFHPSNSPTFHGQPQGNLFYAQAYNHQRSNTIAPQQPADDQPNATNPAATATAGSPPAPNIIKNRHRKATKAHTTAKGVPSVATNQPADSESIHARLRQRPVPQRDVYRYDTWEGPTVSSQQQMKGRKPTQRRKKKASASNKSSNQTEERGRVESRQHCSDTGGSGSRHSSVHNRNAFSNQTDQHEAFDSFRMRSPGRSRGFQSHSASPSNYSQRHRADIVCRFCDIDHCPCSHFPSSDDDTCSHCGETHCHQITSPRSRGRSLSSFQTANMPNASRHVQSSPNNSTRNSSNIRASQTENPDSTTDSPTQRIVTTNRGLPSIRHLEQRLIRIEILLQNLSGIMEKLTGEDANEATMKGEEDDDASPRSSSQKSTKSRKKGSDDSDDETDSSEDSNSSDDDQRKKKKKKENHHHKKKKRKTKASTHSGRRRLHDQMSFKP